MAIRYLPLLMIFFVLADASAQPGSRNELSALQKQNYRGGANDSAAIGNLLKIARWHYEASLKKAYPRSIDSLFYYGEKVINLSRSAGSDLGEANMLLLYSKSALDSVDVDLARKRSLKALDIFRKYGDNRGMADAYLSIAALYDKFDHGKTYIEHAQKARELYKVIGDKVKEAVAMSRLGYIYVFQSDYDNALTSFQESLQLFALAHHRKEELVECQLGIADAYFNKGQLTESLQYRIQAAQLAEVLDPTSFMTARCFNSLGKLYQTSGDAQKAMEYWKKALVIAENYTDGDLSLILANNLAFNLVDAGRARDALFYVKIMESKTKVPDWATVMVVARCLFTYSTLKDTSNARKYAVKAERILSNTAESRTTSVLYSPLAKFYYETAQYDLARKYLEKYRAYAIKAAIKINLQYIHKELFKIDSIQNKFSSAIQNLALSHQHKDSLLNKEIKNRISELNIKYDVFKKDKDLELSAKDHKLLMKQYELQNARVSHLSFTRKASIIGLVALVIVAGLIYSRATINKKNNILLQAKQTEITSNYEAMKRMVQEKELLLKEIHHRVKNNLHVVMSLLKSQSYFLEDQSALAAIRNSQHRIQSMSLIHQKLYMSDNLTAIRMPEYVTELTAYLTESFSCHRDVKFHLKIEDVEMDVSQAVPLGLILNEAITNCFKYAFPDKKGNIRITLENTVHDTFCLEIRDDGIGMSPEVDLEKLRSLGLKLIKGLTEDLDGKLEIDSSNGTSIAVEFTYKQMLLSI